MNVFEQWAFTGRRNEVAALLAGWQAGHGQVLWGAPGSGRSRVAERLADRVGADLLDCDALEVGSPLRGRAVLDNAEALAPPEQQVATDRGCLLVLPMWVPPPDGSSVVSLPPLQAAQTSTLLHRVLGGPVAASASGVLRDRSRGNLRSLVELVRGSVEAGLLVEQHEVWELTGAPQPTALLLARVELVLAGLGADEREALDLLALAEPVPEDWLRGSLGPQRTDRLLRCPLVSRAGEIRLRDDVTRRVVLDALPTLRARRLTRMLLDSSLGDPTARALWADRAGGPVDPISAVSAARSLLANGEPERALQLLERADRDGSVELAHAAIGLHLGRPGVMPSGDPGASLERLWATRALGIPVQRGPLAPLGADSAPTSRVVWPASDLPWDPWPGDAAVDAILAARAGELTASRSLARAALARASSTGWLPDLVWACLALAWTASAIGLPATARRRAREAQRAADSLGWTAIAAMAGDMSAVASAWLREPEASRAPTQCPDPVLAGWAGQWQARARAWQALLDGSASTASRILVDAAGSAITAEDLAGVLELADDLRRLGRPREAGQLVARAASGQPVVAAQVAALRAAESGAAQDWARAAQTYLSLGATARAAECLVQQGVALGGARGAAVLVQAEDLLAGCEGLRSPLSEPGQSLLTGREREVAVMAADGHSSSHIAQRLGISVRTVDNLLARCYQKLQVPGRRDLPEALGLVGGPR